MATATAIADTIETLIVIYGQNAAPATAKGYVWALADEQITDDLLEQAAIRCVQNSKWLPKPAELRQAAFDILNERAAQPHNPAQTYWQAQALFNENLGGRLSDADLEHAWQWEWLQSRRRPNPELPEHAAIWQLVQDESAARMIADGYMDAAGNWLTDASGNYLVQVEPPAPTGPRLRTSADWRHYLATDPDAKYIHY